MTPMVDVVIPVHSEDRPVEIALESAASELQGVRVRAIVVVHNMEPSAEFNARIGAADLVVHHVDGVPSPSGPRNAGLDAGTAPFVFFLDSDDVLAPNCLARVRRVAEETVADVVLPSIRERGAFVGTPLVWSRRRRLVDPVGDEVFIRSHVPALLRRATLEARGLRYPSGIRTGEDFVLMAQLFATGRTAVAFDAVYGVGGTDGSRASSTILPAGQQLAGVRLVLNSEWLRAASAETRLSVARRVLSISLAGSWRRHRGHEGGLDVGEYESAKVGALRVCAKAEGLLSVRDRMSLRLVREPGAAHRLLTSKVFGVIPSSLSGLVSPHGPISIELRSWLVRNRRRRASY